MTGVRSSIFASGARSSDRKPARATAEAGSESQGRRFSSTLVAGAAAFVGAATATAFGLPALNWPVYSRSVVW